MDPKHELAGLLGQAIFLAGLQFAIASTEMSSRFSVENFAKDQATLTNAMNALSTYFIIAVIWTIATCLVLYSSHGLQGILVGIIANGFFVGWIVGSYLLTMRKVAINNGLTFPSFLTFGFSASGVQKKIN